jgi:hypothetical protein
MLVKVFIAALMILQSSWSLSQTSLVGKYRDHFGYSIELNKDGTYKFNYQYDLASGWAIGTWIRQGDIIDMTPTPIMDTLSRTSFADSLVLSLNMVSERISAEQFAIDQITSGGQLPDYAPTKLLFRKDRLYNFDKRGSVKKKKVKGLFTRKKFDPRIRVFHPLE